MVVKLALLAVAVGGVWYVSRKVTAAVSSWSPMGAIESVVSQTADTVEQWSAAAWSSRVMREAFPAGAVGTALQDPGTYATQNPWGGYEPPGYVHDTRNLWEYITGAPVNTGGATGSW